MCKRSFNRQDSLARHAKLHSRESSQYPSPASIDTEQSAITRDEEGSVHSDVILLESPLEGPNPVATDLKELTVVDEPDFSLIWPDSENLFHSIISLDNQWQIPLGASSFDYQQPVNEVPATYSSFEDRVSSIEAIPTGANRQMVHDVSKMVKNLSSNVTAAVEATSINSVFLDECLHMFFVKFIPTFPILHRETFVFRECIHPLLLNAIAIGSLYLGPKDAVRKGEALWSLAHAAISTTWQSLITHRGSYDACDGVQLVITVLLAQLYGSLSKNMAIRTSSQALRAMGLLWARQCGMFESEPYSVARLPTLETSEAEKQYQWRLWVAREIQQRALLAHYMLDGLMASMSGTSGSVRHTANNLTLPSSEVVFDASNASDWLLLMQAEPIEKPQFRNIFRLLFAPVDDGCLYEHQSTAFSYKVVLEGLQSLALESRDGGDMIGAPSNLQVQTALARSYESIKRNNHLSFADRHEVLLRWHAVCLDLVIDTPALCVQVCTQHNIKQTLWRTCSTMQQIPNLTHWATTAEARRALLHAAAIQEIIEQLPRGRAHTIHMPGSLFAASIVYSVFIFAGVASVRLPSTVNWQDALSLDYQLAGNGGPGQLPAASLETRRYLRGEPLFGTTAVARNLLYELNSMQKLFRCLCSQWGIAHNMDEVVDQLITLCH